MKRKKRRYKKVNAQLNEQAIHYEIVINRMFPELQEQFKIGRQDVRLVDSENLVTSILKNKGVIEEGQPTIFDYFRETLREKQKE